MTGDQAKAFCSLAAFNVHWPDNAELVPGDIG